MKYWTAGVVVSLPTLLFAAGSVIDLQFDQPENLGAQSIDGAPDFQVVGDVSDLGGAISLGKSGYLTLPKYSHPKGPFTVEARLRMRSYGNANSRYISDFLNTATWDSGPTQGFALRVGGSVLYPSAPRESYDTEAEWLAAQGRLGQESPSIASRCLGTFVTAMKNNARDWRNVYTANCMDLNRWTHAVGVWDGESMRFYLNGLEATDAPRNQNHEATPYYADTAALFVGARTSGTYDSRHLDGDIDFVRILDTAMTPDQVRERYIETLDSSDRESYCQGAIRVKCPKPLQWADPRTLFELEWGLEGRCEVDSLESALAAGSKLHLQVSLNEGFDSGLVVEALLSKSKFTLEELNLEGIADFTGTVFFRVRLVPPGPATEGLGKVAARKEAVESAVWSLQRPVYVEVGAVTSLKPVRSAPPFSRVMEARTVDALGRNSHPLPGKTSQVLIRP